MSVNRNYKEYGYIDFTKLFQYMEKKNINKQYLLNHGLNKGSIYKLVNNENVTCEVIAKVCYILNTQPKNIMEYRPPETVTTSAPDPQTQEETPQVAPDPQEENNISSFPDSFEDFTPQDWERIRKQTDQRKAEEPEPPEPIPDEDLPFH